MDARSHFWTIHQVRSRDSLRDSFASRVAEDTAVQFPVGRSRNNRN
ncbi:hypothetical protein QUB68_19070 [Microcoleus sp. A006_D1]